MKGLKLKKRLGQNLLVDKNQIRKIMEAVPMTKRDEVLEIGPGTGAITLEMAKRAGKIIAVEKDSDMVSVLQEKIKEAGAKNIEIIKADALELFKNGKLAIPGIKKYKVVANIPYYLTSFLIRNLLEISNPPKDIFLMIQKEVGDRICAKPGEMSILSVAVQYYATPKILFKVPKGCFLPPPKVDSVFIRITPKKKIASREIFKAVKAGFSHPRKQVASNLSKELGVERETIGEWLEQRGIGRLARAESLSVEDWQNFYSSVYNGKSMKERG